QAVKQNYQQQNSKVETAGDNPANGHTLTAIFFRVILDLYQRHNAQNQRDGRCKNAKITTQAERDAGDSQNQRGGSEALLGINRIGGGWRRCPDRLNRRRRNVLRRGRALTAGHVECRLFSRADAWWHGTHQRRWRIAGRQIIYKRGAVLGAESQPLIDELLIAFGTTSHWLLE